MKRLTQLAAIAFVAAATVPVAALADDPLATVQADITQLQTDVKTKHDTVLADAQALTADAQKLAGSDKATAQATIKSDLQKLSGDWKSLLAVCLSDRQKLHTDIAAAKSAGAKASDIRPLVQTANQQIRASNEDMRAGVKSAHDAVVALRQSYKQAGKTAPSTTTPPASPTGAAPVTA
ncbi:MAG: hypothetical protein JO064_01300 [Actinobacteria bacterium]|nr:hypothetical protein [Actinomycetota bacterium]